MGECELKIDICYVPAFLVEQGGALAAVFIVRTEQAAFMHDTVKSCWR